MKKVICILAAASMVAISCQKENGLNVGQPAKGKLTATIANTKVSYGETAEQNLQPAWEVGDGIIGFDDSGNTYTLTVASVSAQTATLSGRVPDGALHLIYKSGAQAGDISSKTLEIGYASQPGDKTMPAVMLADGSVTDGACDFTFANAGAIIGISAVKGVPTGSAITKITVEGANLSEASVALNGNALTLTATSASDDAVSTSALSGITVTDANGTLSSTVFIAVPAGAVIENVIATVDSDTYSYTLGAAKSVTASQYLYVKNQEFTKVSGLTEGPLPGLFSVGNGKQVYFSKGNLQFKAGDGTTANPEWRFAENQYDFIGKAAGNTTSSGRDVQAEWIDLFGWGATGRNPYGQQPYSTSGPDTAYKTGPSASSTETLTRGNGGDWGVCIGDGSIWRTLSADEWNYLLNNDARPDKCQYGVTVCGKTNCVVLAPDSFTGSIAYSYDTSSWAAAEAAGLVCLPAAGLRMGTKVNQVGDFGAYWSSTSTTYSTNFAHYLYLSAAFVRVSDMGNRSVGNSVRLVADSK